VGGGHARQLPNALLEPQRPVLPHVVREVVHVAAVWKRETSDLTQRSVDGAAPGVSAETEEGVAYHLGQVCLSEEFAHHLYTLHLAARGHEVAVHGYRHRNQMRLMPRAFADDLRRAGEVIGEARGSAPQLYRPPYGIFTVPGLATVRSAGLVAPLWSQWALDWRAKLPASSQPGHVLTILGTLEDTKANEKTSMSPLLHQLAQQIRRRGVVFLISDCFDDVESLLGGLQHLRFEGHDVTVFHVMHPDELEFPLTGMIRFEGLEEKQEVLTRPHLIRPAYQRAVKAYLETLRKGCENNRCDYVLLNTGRPVAEAMASYLARRLRTKI